jgi:YtcA family
MRCFKKRCAVGAIGVAVAAMSLTAGCAGAPSVNVLGAYFPDWLFCAVAGVVLAVIVYRILSRTHYSDWLGPMPVFYPTLVTFFALVVWLIFFQH